MPGGPDLTTIHGAVVDGDGQATLNGRTADTDVRGRRRLLLVALACAGIGLLLTHTPSPARAAQAPAAQTSSGSCGNGGGSESVFSFTPGTKLLFETNLQVCVTGRVTVTFAGDPPTGAPPMACAVTPGPRPGSPPVSAT
jgi:hypothetical protein